LAILEALEDAPEHPSAEDLFDAVHRAQPGLHRSTVYRTLDTLEREGILVHAHLGHGSAAYHLAASSHVHAACISCGAVVEVPSELLDDLGTWLADAHGFALDARHFALTGRCAACAGVSRGRR
jgi:Fur family ferric uptake transcriptional regulator